ncbi:hypothetical protein FUA48_16035 [Flavobacterium alkalisoli]|uniref:Uncharacterized protein n=1 Tax=Flavobacterium alkalisoli TaxID=2602769 RepID=A0A5B9FVI9_9FLAO|nr:hypothetical protein [Flavobacterium alkalisoli]QEE51030.1 hypothetical protein FUA48_16035 [Flavobacterium alkalisoli]
MWFDVNFLLLLINELPINKRKLKNIRFLSVLLKPIETVYYNWFQLRKENIYKLNHNGQVCYLRKSLNDKFDTVLRRIYITNGQINETAVIYTEAEQQDEYIGSETEEDFLWLYTEGETGDTGLDFIVYVPQEVYDNSLHSVNAHIRFYKAGGKRYTILVISE